MIRRYRYVAGDLDAVRSHAGQHGAEIVEWGEGVDVLVSTEDREAWLDYDSTLPVAPDTVGPDEAIGEPPAEARAWAAVTTAAEDGDMDAIIVAVAEARRARGLEPSAELVAKLEAVKGDHQERAEAVLAEE